MMCKLAPFALILAALSLSSCTDTERAGLSAYGKPHHIKQFACGQLIGEWDSTGKVENENGSDGFRFEDAKTHNIVEVSGTLQITIEAAK